MTVRGQRKAGNSVRSKKAGGVKSKHGGLVANVIGLLINVLMVFPM